MMGDKPIIFSAPMVRALLDGRKTQTRRVLKPQPNMLNGGRPLNDGRGSYSIEAGWKHLPCTRGDRLWVREAFIGHYAYEVNEYPPRDWGNKPIWFPADGPVPDKFAGQFWHRARPSTHMPRWASRLTLTVTDVRVQRLQEISEADAVAEGCEATGWRPTYGNPDNAGFEESIPAKDAFADLWSSLHGPGAWEANPWVAAYSFTVQLGNIDAIKEPSND